MKYPIFPSLHSYLAEREKEFDLIPDTRKEVLKQLSAYLSSKYQAKHKPELIVICTHNSRRSHMGQVWLAVASEYLNLPALASFSGGTAATDFNPRAVAALQKTGLDIQTQHPESSNPVYTIHWKEGMKPYEAFSKTFDSAPNPQADFAAIMVCSEADEACPFVAGADFRLSLPYDDPKAFDGTELEASKYEERARQIAREILFSLKNVSYI